MNFDKYIDNPSGGASVVTNRSMYKQMYRTKFDSVMVRENGVVKYKVYHSNDKFDSYYIYFKIPSEVVPDFYYDVVVQLYTKDAFRKNAISLREYSVKFYSNDPAFMYTFAHSFAKNDLFIKDLESKMSKEALKKTASVKNPNNMVWYVKSLYFAYLAMEKYNLFNRKILDTNSSPYDKNKLLQQIMHAEQKVKLRQDAGIKIEKERANEKKLRPNAPRNKEVSSNISPLSKTTKVSKVSKTSNITKNTSKTKIIGMKKK